MAKRPTTLKATAAMATAAARGLELRKRFNRGGTEVGVRRAHQLANREPISPRDVKAMHSYFARHAVDKQGKARKWGDESDPSAGFIAWLLWGGEPGRKWAAAQRARLG